MNKLYSAIISPVAAVITAVIIAAGVPVASHAFPVDSYAETSKLAQGKWVKIRIPATGLYMVTTSDLRRYGFSNPSAVRVMGYGGQRINDVLTAANYVDDLMAAPQEATSQGIVFYGQGPESYTTTTLAGSKRLTLHTLNPFSTHGYYFLTDAPATDEEEAMPEEGEAQAGENAATTFVHTVFHETDMVSPGESGHILVGEDFRYTRSHSFTFDTPDAADNSMLMQIKFVVATSSATTLDVSLDGITMEEPIKVTASTSKAYGALTTWRKEIEREVGARTMVALTYNPSGSVKLANLDAIDINYNRQLKLYNGSLCFTIASAEALLENAGSATRVWDVTDVTAPKRMRTAAQGTAVGWTNSFGGQRRYAAWSEDAKLPSPEFVDDVPNQDLHAQPVPDMVIFTPAEWIGQARRVAELHAQSADSLRVLVVTDEQVFNEFSSGTPDVGAFRRLLKMMWDRGTAPDGHRLQYAMLFGRTTHDHRMLTASMQSLKERTLVGWNSDEGLRESESYCSDDILAMLLDGAGQRMVFDTYCIGVGRVPAGTPAEAKAFVDKLYAYVNNSKPGPWKNRVMLVADDGDTGIHLEQSERMMTFFNGSTAGPEMFYDKVYVDAYDEVGGASVIGRQMIHGNLEDGTVWWNYIGHASKQSLSTEKIFTYSDFNTVRWRQLPFLYAATCSFMRWDGIDKSGAEILMHNTRGGLIGAFCPVREVYISENELMSNAVARNAFTRDSLGRRPAIGDIYRMSKNNVVTDKGQTSSSANKLRYVLMGDPAMRLVTPDAVMRVDSINGVAVDDPDVQPTIMAHQKVRVTGSVLNPHDNMIIADFSGQLTAVLYDSEYSITTQGRASDGTQGKVCTFEQQGKLLFTGCGTVTDGRFQIDFAMPEDIANNFRPAALNLHAAATDGREAVSCFRNLYVYGYDDTADADSVPPSIDFAYLNHPTFADGDAVNPSPMFIARVTDNVGINLSSAGIGHRLTIKIDGNDSYADLASYYAPLSDGSIGGTVTYQLEDLMPGRHELMFRVWDTSGNSSTHTMSFSVDDRLAPDIVDVYTDANPASTHANFYVSHNRPDAEMTVKIEVFALNGRLEWSSEENDRSDMGTSAPITWDLCNQAGHRVARGIYLYRATITCNGQTSQSVVRRLAVTGS